MERTKDQNAPLSQREVYQNAINQIGIIRGNDYLYDRYMETGKMYFKQFDTSFDISNIDAPTGNFFDRIGNNLTNAVCWVIGVTITYVGLKVTYHKIKKSSGTLGKMLLKLSKNKRFLGIALIFLGIFIIGLDLYTNTRNQESKEAQVYLRKGLNTKTVLSSLNSDFVNMVKNQEITIGGMLKKMVLSTMGILDITFSTFRRILDRSIEKPLVQFGLVVFVVGIYMSFSKME